MARGRPRKDGTGNKPKEKVVEPDVLVEGAEAGQKRVKRKAATAAIKKVMDRYKLTPSSKAAVPATDMEVEDGANTPTEDTATSSSATCTLLFTSLGLNNDSSSDKPSSHDTNVVNDANEDMETNVENMKNKNPSEPITKESATSRSPTDPGGPGPAPAESPSKTWTSAIWGAAAATPRSESPQPASSARAASSPENLRAKSSGSVSKSSSKRNKSKIDKQSASSGSTPSNSSSGTPRSETPDLSSKNKKSSIKKGKSGKVRRRIRTLSDMDSEDSELSTDSPLKPKTYSDNPAEQESTAPTLRSTRIPKKNKNDVKSEAMKPDVENHTSPDEELPLIPKGFLQQQKKEQELKDKLDSSKDKKVSNGSDIKLQMSEEDKLEVDKRIQSFKQIKDNQYLCKRVVNKQSKNMQCDCTLSKEEAQQGEKGCGDECINKLLFIECGKHCVLENNCCNKRFQNNQHADVEVFKTDWKGVGLRARSFIPKDTFIMEYVGEVLDSRLFRKRAKQYAKDNVQHFYFMALSKDQFVDATCKGNISRFINHSCDPNSETQKWTVNGELRVGFFTKRSIKPGEEVSFDYKFERYGNVAQKCFCGSSQCRGWLGGEPGGDSGIEEVEEWSDDDDDEEEMETHETVKKEKKKKEKKKKPKKPKKMEVDDCEEEIEKLMVTGIRNRNHTLQLCRLMLRATTTRLRLRMADMLFEADQPCLRLFLDYQGLRILYSWMFELEWSVEDLELKLRIESVLSILPMPHKTILVDSKILQTVEKWRDSSGQGVEAGSGEASRATTPTAGGSRVASPDKEDQAGDTEAMEAEPSSEAATPPPEDLCPPGEEPPDVTMPGCVDTRVDEVRGVLAAQAGVADQRQDTAELEDVSMEECRVEPVPREQRPLTEEEERLRAGAGAEEEEEASLEQQMVRDIQARARDLLEAWAGLQEMFRIPKKERQAARREHERDADRDHRDDAGHHQEREPGRRLSTSGPAPGPAQRQYPSYKSYHEGGRDAGLVRGGFVRPGSRRNLRLDDRTGRLCKANLYKNDKRMLFQAKVEEERRQKVARDAIFARHDQCCRLLGLSPAHTPMLPRYPEFYLLSGKWVPMPPPPHPIDPSWTAPGMAALPPQAFKPGDPPLPNPRSIYPPGCCPEPEPEPVTSLDQSETEADICSFYDKLYYGEGRSQSHSSTPSPAHRSPLSEAISAQLHQNSLDYSGSQELSPDYRSPSPVVRSPPTSLQFLSSAPAPGQDAVLQSHAAELSAAHEEQVLQHEAAQPEALPASALNVEPPSQNIPRDGGDSGGLVVRIPPKWRTARDGSGRVYYYHAVTKQTQWEIPAGAWHEDLGEDTGGVATTREESHRMETNDTDSDEDRGEDGDDTDTEEESEEENEENGVPEQEPEVSEIPDSDLSASEKRMLLRMRRRTKEERRNMRRIKREKFKERHEQERLVTRERHKRHRSDGLVVEHLVPARISDKDKVDLMTFKEMRERLLNKDKIREQQLKEEREEEEKERREERARVEKIRREEKRAAEKAKRESDFRQLTGEDILDASITSTPDKDVSMSETPSTIISTPQSSVTSSAKTTQAAADTSSDMGKKKHKDKFLKEMSKVVVKILDPYRKKGVKGHIGNTDDFKHLAKKLTFTIMQKELKACKSTEELKANDKVRKKASDYVSKYMKKYDREYRRSPDQADD